MDEDTCLKRQSPATWKYRNYGGGFRERRTGKWPSGRCGECLSEKIAGCLANQLAQLGFVVLAFDPAFMGDSGGEPRHVSSPDIFAENFSAGVDYLGSLPYVDREKIGAVGICGSGGFALSAAQVDIRIKAVATASMYDIMDGSRMPFDTPEKRTELFVQLGHQRWQDFESGAPEYLPSFPEKPAEEVPEELDPVSAEFFSYYGLKRGHHPNARGGFTTTSMMAMMNFRSLDFVDKIPFDKLEDFFKKAFEGSSTV